MAKQPKRLTRAQKEATETVQGGVTTDTPLSFTTQDSATIAAASYDPDTETLTVEFKHGKTYTYTPIRPELWAEFEQASSKGTFFGKRIRPLYAGQVKA